MNDDVIVPIFVALNEVMRALGHADLVPGPLQHITMEGCHVVCRARYHGDGVMF